MTTFTDNFDKFALHGESISVAVDGFDVTARIEFDSDTHIDDDDVHTHVDGFTPEQQESIERAREAWQNDEWFYCGIVLSISKAGITLEDHAASLWGIEVNYPGGDNDYLAEAARDLLPEALEVGKDQLAKLCNK